MPDFFYGLATVAADSPLAGSEVGLQARLTSSVAGLQARLAQQKADVGGAVPR